MLGNDKVKEIFWQCYNVFWNRWKSMELTRQSPEWEDIIKESGDLMKKYNCDLCNHIICDLITELESRYKENREERD